MRLGFQMPARLDAIDEMVVKLRLAVQPFLAEEALFGFEIAVSEALTNVVKHSFGAFAPPPEAKVEVTLCCDETITSIELLDHGVPGPADMFASVPQLDDIDILAEHGRGLSLIKHYTESADYSSDEEGNRLRLVFKT